MRFATVVLVLVFGARAVGQEGDARTQAEAHRDRGKALVSEGKLEEARAEFEKARALYQEAKDASGAAAMLRETGGLLVQHAAFEEAAEIWKRYRQEQSAIHGGDHADVAKGLCMEAYCLQRLGRPGEALQRFEESLGMIRRLFKGDHPGVAVVLGNEALCLRELGRPEEALPLFEESLGMMRRLFKGDHLDVAAVLNDTASCLLRLGRLGEALPLFEESLGMRRRLFKDDHPDMAASLSNVASCLQDLGRPGEALRLLDESLAMCRRLFNGDHSGVTNVLNLMALCLQDLGQLREALALFEESLGMMRRLFKGDHPSVATGLHNVARCLEALGRSGEALALFEESLAMCRRLFKGDHPDVAAGLNTMAACLNSLGRTGEALPLFEESLGMMRRLFKGDHPHVATVLNDMGCCLLRLGRLGEALSLVEESLGMRRRLFKGDHPDVAAALGNEASCLHELGRPGEALPLLEESLGMARRLFEGDHLLTASTLGVTGSCLASLGRVAEALALREESLAMMRRLFPGDHSSVAVSMVNVAICLQRLGRPGEALPLCEESLAMSRRLFKGDHDDVAAGLDIVASCLVRLGRLDEALPLFEQSLGMRRRLFTGDHPRTTLCLNNLAHCLSAVGRSGEALPLLEESLAMCRRLFKGDHPHLMASLSNVAACLDLLGRVGEGVHHLEEAVAMARRSGDAHGYKPMTGLAAARMAANETRAAVSLLQEAIDLIEGLRSGEIGLTEGDRGVYFEELKGSWTYLWMIRAQHALKDDGEALRFVERARGRSLLDLLDRSRLDPLAELRAQAEERGDAKLVAQLDEVRAALRAVDIEVGRLTHAVAALQPTWDETEERQAEIRKRTAELAEARKAREEVLRRQARLIGSQLRVAVPSDAAALQRLAGREGRVLLYVVTDQGAMLFVVPPPGSEVRALDLSWPDGTKVDANGVALKVEEHARQVEAARFGGRGVDREAPEKEGGSWRAGHDLFRALMPADVWADVQKAKTVYIVADGALQRVAFESLPVDKGGERFWIDAGPPIVYGPSGSALIWSREQGDRQRSQGRLDEVVILGDPVFARSAPPEQGVVVVAVTDDGQARRLGIGPGDVIVAYGGKPIEAPEALGAAIREGSGEPTVALWRAGERRELKVAAGPLGVRLSREPVAEALRQVRGADPLLMRASAERSGALSRYGELLPLPGTRREAEAIAEALGSPGPLPVKVTLLLGEEATAPGLRRAAPRARYLHIATHGLADETEFASYSSLALTLPRVPTAEDDGFLSLADVLSGWRGALTRCELVVLSACETQRGFEQRDEGVYALPVGFLYAGAPSVIASLWRVDDASTAELFADFYGRLRAGKGKLEAFTEARKALKKTHPEPYHWAPFVYVGDPR